MKATKLLVAAASGFFLSTTAFAQIRPSDSNTTNNGSMTTSPQPGFGTTPDGRIQRGTTTNRYGGATDSRTSNKTKMTGRKGTKKAKMSNPPSTTGTM